MKFKQYQQNTLDMLEEFLGLLKKLKPKLAFHELTDKSYNHEWFGDTPFVCIKIPTGGGKTLVGSKAVALIMSKWLQHKMDTGIVMWFVPSDAIKAQTLKKFNDKNDWHRQVLDEAFENRVKIFSNEEALAVSKEDVKNNLCVVVSSLDAFRKDKTLQKKYKVYKENGALMTHFQNLEDDSELEKDSEKTVVNSLANVIRKHEPLIVIDEGHHTQTALSVQFLSDLNPSFLLEFTATPREGSNVLVDVSASELKAEEMVKIPIVLESRTQWEQLTLDGLAKRKELEQRAHKLKGEYIRPIALIQAQPKSATRATLTIERMKEFLLADGVKKDEIAIKISGKDELEGINLFSKECPIKYVLTVSALTEGWDCSFAYVLISVANLGARVAVEQVIGRVIRMPIAKRKKDEALNRSYVFASAANFSEAANRVIKGLENNGYNRTDFVEMSRESTYTDPLEAKKAVKTELTVPLMAFGKEPLAFEDLLGEDFKLAKQNPDFIFDIHYDLDGQAIIDISEDDEWFQGKQLSLPYKYLEGEHTADELVQWLDKKLRFSMLEKNDKVRFLEKAVENQIKRKKHSLPELSVNRYLLANRLEEVINEILEEHTKKVFTKVTGNEISVRAFDPFPKTINLKTPTARAFNKCLYERIDPLNGEEQALVDRIDLTTLDNLKFWVRNREKIDPFYLQGWKRNKFYPDFVAVTKKGNIIALEWKGEDRLESPDTKYKVEIARVWEKLGKGKLHFFLVHNGNAEEVLTAIKEL